MKRLELIQLSFEKGMIENIKQDGINYQELSSVLWLNNYNPNIEMKSAVKRYGLSYESNIPILDVLSYNEGNKDSLLYSTLLKTSLPSANDTRIVFISNTGGLYVVAYVLDTPEGLRWWNAIKDGSIEDVYKGHNIKGLFQDVSRYGESLIFCTIPNSDAVFSDVAGIDNKTYFPCYKFFRWDISKKKDRGNQFWNGIDITLPPAFWKIKNPAMELVQELKVGFENLVPKYHINDECVSANKLIDYITGLDALSNEIGIVIKEFDFYQNPLDTPESGERYTNIVPLYNPRSDDVWWVRSADKNGLTGRYWSDSHTSVYETAGWDLGIDADNILTICTFELLNNKLLQADFEAHLIELLNYNRLKLDYGRDRTRDPDYYSRGNLASMSNSPKEMTYYNNDIQSLVSILDIGEIRYWINKKEGSTLEDLLGIHVSSNYEEKGDLLRCCPVLRFPHYIAASIPRPWYREEKIPIVLTVVIDGIEVPVFNEIYEVKKNYKYNFPFNNKNPFNKHDNLKDYTNHSLCEQALFIEPDWDGSTSNSDSPLYEAQSLNLKIRDLPKYWAESYAEYIYPLSRGRQKEKGIYKEFCVQEYNTILITIRLSEEAYKVMTSNNVSKINLYVSRPSDDNSMFKSVGDKARISAPPVLFHFPEITYIDKNKPRFSDYFLVKSFVIDGKGTLVEDYTGYKGENAIASNAWYKDLATNDYWGVPQQDLKSLNPTDTPGNGDVRDISSELLLNVNHQATGFTPDFLLWDYPTTTSPLSIQASGIYWRGRGARCIIAVKGRTILGGCIDQDGKEEQARMRFSAVQNGLCSPDIFNDEDWIDIGHLPHTAFLEFREQILVFNRQNSYRINPTNIFDVTEWEINEVLHSGGTFNPKTVCVCPQGYVYCNEMGIWISEGGIPQCLTAGVITSLYQKIVLNKTYIFANHIPLGNFFDETQHEFNPYMELLFDDYNNELILISPYTDTDSNNVELRLIYSFVFKNWRVETYTIPTYTNTHIKTSLTNIHHRQHFNSNKIYNTILQEELATDSFLYFNKPDFERQLDQYLFDNIKDDIQDEAIKGEIISHDIGDGKNDFSIHSIIAEVIPREKDAEGGTLVGWRNYIYQPANEDADPNLILLLRDKEYSEEELKELFYVDSGQYSMPSGRLDLVRINFIAKYDSQAPTGSIKQNPFNTLTTPGMTNYNRENNYHADSDELFEDAGNISQHEIARESMILLSPIRSKFRRMKIKWKSEMAIKVKSFVVKYIVQSRKTI